MKYIKIGKQIIYVSEEVYEAWRSSHRQERYQKENDYAHGVVSIDAMKQEVSSKTTIEDVFEKNENSKILWNALNTLSEDEFRFINLHYFEKFTLSQLAELYNMSYQQCWYYRKKLLNKLRKIIGNID